MFNLSTLVLRGDQEMIWKVGVCNKPQKQKNTAFLAPIIVLNKCMYSAGSIQYTLSRKCNFEFPDKDILKHFPKK